MGNFFMAHGSSQRVYHRRPPREDVMVSKPNPLLSSQHKQEHPGPPTVHNHPFGIIISFEVESTTTEGNA